MRILILQGSPRKNGNTETVCHLLSETLARNGASVESLRLAEMTIGGCQECFSCQRDPARPGCAIEDDMGLVYEKVLSSDGVIVATPVFCWCMSAQMRLVMDRFYAFCKFGHTKDGRFICLIEGKRFGLVVTAGGGPYDGAELCVASYRAMADFMRLDNRGELVVAPAAGAEKLRGDTHLLSRVHGFGRAVSG